MLIFIICEDNKEFLNKLSNVINKVMMPYNFEYKINKFTQYDKEVERMIHDNNEIKIYILDIELPVVSGLEIASSIRENDSNSIIIFVTSYPEFKNDIFYSRLVAMDYICKDKLWEDRFFKTIDYTVKSLNKKNVLIFEYNYNTYRIPFSSILYIEKLSDDKKCVIYTIDGESYYIIDTISGLYNKLSPNFYRSHKSCIINLDNVKKINYLDNTITFSNNSCAYLLSNRNKKALKEYVTNY